MSTRVAVVLLTLMFAACSGPGVEQVHEQILVIDAHADIEIPGRESVYAGADGRSEVAPDKMRAGGVDVVVMAAAVGPQPRNADGYASARARAEEEIAAIQGIVAGPHNNVVLARSPDDLYAAQAEGKGALILGFQNALILGEEVAYLDELYAAGVRVFALTHMGHNDFADSSRPLFISEQGAHEPASEHGGLSDLGRAAIRRINELGGMVDVSQLSREATLEAVKRSAAPVIASHSNVRALTDVSRNLSDEEIDAIAAAGGAVCVAPFAGYLFDSSDGSLDAQIRGWRKQIGLLEDYLYHFELYWENEDEELKTRFLDGMRKIIGPSSVSRMIDHLDYVVQRVGIDHACIGTDFNHGSAVTGFADASEAMNVTAGLLERGYSAKDVEKIWGGNFVRVFRQAQSAVSD